MDPTTWTPRRALVFARGLYHVAVCDGLHPRETAAVRAFCARARLDVALEALGAEPFDFAEAAAALDSPWLRRVFVEACRRLVQVDGQVTPTERDLLRSMAAALGLGEAVALAPLPADGVSPEELVEWIAGLAVDLVAWDEDARPAVFWDFPHPTHPLADGGSLRVEPAQALVVHRDGAVTDVLGPGEHRLTRDTLPGLAACGEWRDGTVRTRLTFVATGPQPPWRWGTTDAIPIAFGDGAPAPVRAFGRFALRIVDAGSAFARFARAGAPSPDDFRQRAGRMLSGRFGAALAALAAETGPDFSRLLADLQALSEAASARIAPGLREAGLDLRRFHVENVTTPFDVPRVTGTMRQTRSLEVVRLTPCDECLTPVPVTAKFCPKCGTARRRACACGGELPERAKFCPDCGKAV